MTQTVANQVAEETLEEIAERVVDENLDTYHYAFTRQALITAALSALRNEREACAKVAESKAEAYRGKMQTQRRRGDHSLSEHFHSEQNAALQIAAAIREGR